MAKNAIHSGQRQGQQETSKQHKKQPQGSQNQSDRILLKTGSLGLLVGLFKIKEKRTVSLWNDRLEYSLAKSFASNNANDRVGTVNLKHVHVSHGEGDKRFVVRDSAHRVDHIFVAHSATEKNEWMQEIDRAVGNRLKAIQKALSLHQKRIDAIAKRLGVESLAGDKKNDKAQKKEEGNDEEFTQADVEAAAANPHANVSADATHPPAAPTEAAESAAPTLPAAVDAGNASSSDEAATKNESEDENEKSTTTHKHNEDDSATPATESRPTQHNPAHGTQLSQEVVNAAMAVGVDPNVLETDSPNRVNNRFASASGPVRLDGDTYWYEVQSTDTLAGICLRFDAAETQVRRANHMAKRSVDSKRVLRIPRHCTADPNHDYTDASGQAIPTGRKLEDPMVRRKRQQAFKIHVMVLLSAQRALKAEDCFTKTEALAYLNLHDGDLNVALDAMEQDQEWDDQYGYLFKQRQARVEQALHEHGDANLSKVVAENMAGPPAPEVVVNAVPVELELKEMNSSSEKQPER